MDIFGELHCLNIPSYSLSEDHFKYGLQKLDASSIRGFKSVDDSDLLLMPDASTLRELPPYYDNARRTARIFVDIYDKKDAEICRFDKDSRGIVRKTHVEMEKLGFTQARFGPEIEFFVFDSIRLIPAANSTLSSGTVGYSIKSIEAPWSQENTSLDPKDGYYTAKPKDTLDSIRKDICDDIHKYFDVNVEAHHHEVAASGQCEINIQHDQMLPMGDMIISIKNLIKMKAKHYGKVATFMPKPIYGDNASAMHIHHSIFAGSQNVFYDQDDAVAGLSQTARYYIGGILEHASALSAIANPTTNSYKRLVPGYEAPVGVCWGLSNRTAAIRIPKTFNERSNSKRIEYRVPDPMANIYLLESAILLAGIDGVRRKIDPGSPVEESVYSMSPQRLRDCNVKFLPATLKESLDALRSDSGFLSPVFTDEFVDTYCTLKYKEYALFAQTPTVWEIAKYSDM